MRALLLLLVGIVTLWCVVPTAQAALSQVTAFVNLGDWGCPNMKDPAVLRWHERNPSFNIHSRDYHAEHQIEKDVARAIGDYARGKGIDEEISFILSIGDNFYEYGVESISDPQWKSSFEDIFTDPVHLRPWHVVAGNHDYEAPSNLTAQIEYSKKSDRWFLPELRFTYQYPLPHGKNMVIIYFYSGSFVVGTPEQAEEELQYIENELIKYNATADFLFVAGHHPVLSIGENGNTPSLTPLKPILEHFAVTGYIGGHDHILQYLTDTGVNYFGSGSGCRLGDLHVHHHLPSTTVQYADRTNGFMVHRIHESGTKMTVTMVDYKGRERYKVSLPSRVLAY